MGSGKCRIQIKRIGIELCERRVLCIQSEEEKDDDAG